MYREADAFLRPIGGTEGMDRLSPKGSKIESQIPLQRMGDPGELFIHRVMPGCL